MPHPPANDPGPASTRINPAFSVWSRERMLCT
jgi:hypothetical protein